MARDHLEGRARDRLAPARDLRWFASALLVASAAACCPVPLAAPAGTPTAFVAIVATADGSSWVAEGPGGALYPVPGVAPAAAGERVYLSGVFAPDGSLEVERADPLGIR